MIHVFHGFLGSPDDFSFLKRDGVTLYDLTKKLDLTVSSEDIFLGYSMGGRIALEYATRLSFNIKKLVLLAAHPGLTEEVRKSRITFEDEVIERLTRDEAHQFLSWWNALPLFTSDRPLKISQTRYLESKHLFAKHRLSQQENYQELLRANASKILYVVGTHDAKYKTIAEEQIAPLGIKVRTLEAGHRLFQKPQALEHLLLEEQIL